MLNTIKKFDTSLKFEVRLFLKNITEKSDLNPYEEHWEMISYVFNKINVRYFLKRMHYASHLPSS